MTKLSFEKIKKTRNPKSVVSKSFRLHPDVEAAFKKRAFEEGCSEIHLLEKMIVHYLNGVSD